MIIIGLSCAFALSLIFITWRKRLYAVTLACSALFILYVQQGISIYIDLQSKGYAKYLGHSITFRGFTEASLLLCLSLTMLLGLCIFSSTIRRPFVPIASHQFTRGAYICTAIIQIIIVIATFSTVGVNSILSSSRPGDLPGFFLLISIMQIGLLPCLCKQFALRSVSRYDLSLFLLTSAYNLFFSRLHFIQGILPYVLLYLYKSSPGGHSRHANTNLRFVYFTLAAISLLVVFVLVGAYRHALNFSDMSEIPEESNLLDLGLINKISIEGMSSFAGAVSAANGYSIDFCKLCFPSDLGLFSSVKSIYLLAPSFIKSAFVDAINPSDYGYWYDSSIVSSLYESLLIHFGYLGVIFVAPFSIYALSVYPVFRLLSSQSVRVKLFSLLFLSSMPAYVRGSIPLWIGQIVIYSFLSFVFDIVLRLRFKSN
jgi:hypothetical protein